MDSQVIVTHEPSPGYYNHEYQLITVDHSDQDKLFVSPASGSHYRMKVQLYSTAD